MNEKISFPDLVTLLAAKLNVTKKEAENCDFLYPKIKKA